MGGHRKYKSKLLSGGGVINEGSERGAWVKSFKAIPVIQIQEDAIGWRYRYKLKKGKLLIVFKSLYECKHFPGHES